MSKKVVIIGPAYPYRGGQSLVEAHLYHTLSEEGYEVETVSFKMLYPKVFFPGKTQFDESEVVIYDHRNKIHRIIDSLNPLSWWKAARKVKNLKADIVIFVWWMPFFGPAYTTIAKLVKRWTKARLIFLVENYISHEERWFDKLWSKITLNHADAFICQSNYVKDNIQRNHKQPIHQTTLSVFDCYDFKKYNKKSARDLLGIKSSKVVLFFGLIRPYKGLDKLILAFNQILTAHPDTTLLIVGEAYEDIEKYKALITSENIAEHTIMINEFIANEKVEPYFKAADVVCLPYNSATQSGILMMAYGMRIPVIATDVGGLSELILENKTGKILPNNDKGTVAQGVIDWLDNQGKIDAAGHIANLSHSLGYQNLSEIVG